MDTHREALDQNSEILPEQQCLNEATPPKRPPTTPNNHPMASLILLAKTLILFLFLLTVFLTIARLNRPREPLLSPSTPPQENKVRMSMLVPQPFPKILWVLCGEGGPQGLAMLESVGAQHQISVGKASGFDVRVVDLINAYDWLSAGTVELIRQAKHNTQYYIPVAELLRVALLLEHGGVSAKLDSIVFTQRLDWIQDAFNYDPPTLKKLQQESVLCPCNSEGLPEILLFSQGSRTTKWFQTSLIIARADSRLLREVFSQMVQVLRHSRRAYDAFQNFGWYNNDRTITMEGFLPNLLSFRSRYWNTGNQFCREYRVLEINRKEGSFMETFYVWPRIAGILLRDREAVFQDYGRSKVLNVDLKAVWGQLMEAAKFQSLGDAHPNSLFREILNAEGNEWLLRPIIHTRDPKLCIVSLKPIPFGSHQKPIHRSLTAFEKDSFKNWQAVFFVDGLNSAVAEFSTHPAVTMVNASQWEGLNLQRAATRYCHSQSVIIILDYDQKFDSDHALTRIADQFRDRRVFAAFVGATIGNRTIHSKPDRVFRTKVIDERLDNVRQIAVSLRAFSVYSYRLVGQFDLHDSWGRYYNRQIPLNTLLQMQNTANDRCEETEMKFHVKRAESEGKELPRTRVYMPDLVVMMSSDRQIDLSLPEYVGKHDAHEWCEALEEYYERIKGPLKGFFVLNNGSEFEGLQNRRHLPPLIPSKIHQVWIGNVPLPDFKQQLMDHFKATYPTWEHRLWTNADITRDNFPLTYDLIQTLFQFDKRSPSDKMAMISDIMRLEILYRQGGFYFDTNYYIFKGETLQDWRSFEDIFVGQLVPFYKFQRENSLMACVPGSARFLRLLDHRRLSTRNLFSRWANMETGPAYVSFAVQGEEEMAPTVFQPAYEWVYPWYYGSNVANACQAPPQTPDQQLLFRQRHAYWKNCSQVYKGAFGIQFFLEGGSWMVDRE